MTNAIPYPFELMTERLLIRSPSVAVAPHLCEAIEESIETLRPWMPWATHVPSIAEELEICAKAAQDFRDNKDFRLHLFLRSSGVLIGGSGLHYVDWSIPKFEIGYWVRPSYSGRGYITEAVFAIMGYAFKELGAKRVEIQTSTRNIKSWRIPERLGFTLEGILRNNGRHVDGSLKDTKVYARIPE